MQVEQPTASWRVLMYVLVNETMASLEALERQLMGLGWEHYYEDHVVVQLYRCDGCIDLISLPCDFARFCSTHMYDIVLKNRGHSKVVDLPN